MAVGKASVADLDMHNLVVVGCRLAVVGPVLGTISCEDSSFASVARDPSFVI